MHAKPLAIGILNQKFLYQVSKNEGLPSAHNYIKISIKTTYMNVHHALQISSWMLTSHESFRS